MNGVILIRIKYKRMFPNFVKYPMNGSDVLLYKFCDFSFSFFVASISFNNNFDTAGRGSHVSVHTLTAFWLLEGKNLSDLSIYFKLLRSFSKH